MAEKYQWNYCSLGGVVRIKIDSGEDIAHLGELDQKLWTVLSCPSHGLQFDQTTLSILDSDGDGKIRVHEVVSAAQWLTSLVKDKDLILKGDSSLPLDQINDENPEGAVLLASAKKILSNLGLEKDSISISDTADSAAIFAQTKFNGDGVITEASTEDESQKKTIAAIVASMGCTADRSGAAGVDAAKIGAFYDACAAYSAWKSAETADILPYGDNTEAALAACEAIAPKVSDYFMRCKLIDFDEACEGTVNVTVGKIGEVSAQMLDAQTAQIAECPIARPTKKAILPFDSINPAWQAAFASVKSLVFDIDFKGEKGISEDQWNATLAKFGAYKSWKAAKAGYEVEGLGLDAVNGFLKADEKAALLSIVDADLAVKSEADAIAAVDKLLHLYRYFYQFVKNYVTLKDFYSTEPDTKAMFEVGKLYIDQRCCELCLKVENMGAHGDMAGLSGIFLIYCTCTSKVLGKTMDIVAVMTDGNVKNLRPGKNAIFYDRNGQDWDAVVTKVIDNPISIKQAFWSPYRKFADTITARINKSAADKENKVHSDMAAKANNLEIPTTEDGKKAAATAKAPFDIAKFAGIFAAIGMAVGYLTTGLAALVKPWYMPFVVLLVLVVCISGPSMFLAWQKLRKRNLGPVLNANGWAINSSILINIIFGATLTSIAKYPLLTVSDPFVKKKSNTKPIIITIVVALVLAFGALFFTDNLKCIGLPFHKEEAKVECTVCNGCQKSEEPQAETQAEAPAEEQAATVAE